MMKRIVTRVVVPIFAGIGAMSLIAVAAAGMRGSARDTLTAYACEWGLLSEATCYPDTGSSRYGDILDEIMADRKMEKDLAPIIAEQERLKAEKREWGKNSRASDQEIKRSFIVGCERDKLSMMQEGKDVSAVDCRKNSTVR
jgi:hypothetical protein